MELIGSNKSKITKNQNGKNVPHLETNEVVLVNCNLSMIIINKIQECCLHLFLINHLLNYQNYGSMVEILMC